MIAICGIENELAVFADGERGTVVHHGGRHHSDSRVAMIVVVPGEECLAESRACNLNRRLLRDLPVATRRCPHSGR
jgi:hypothetical protein